MMTIDKLLNQIEKSLLLSDEFKKTLTKVAPSLNKKDLYQLLEKLQTEEQIINKFLLKIINTKEDYRKFEKFLQKTKLEMYRKEEKQEGNEENPENLLKNL